MHDAGGPGPAGDRGGEGRFSARAELPDAQHEFVFEFIGLMGLEDPIRPTVPAAVAECDEAGIKVVMITGDYPVTAQKIARQIGMRGGENVITGQELARMSPEELRDRVRETTIFARVVPEQKLLIVDAFKANGEVVAMTGDGVNDAPALKSAHIGVAMGERGTDVAREASALVLLDDDFSSIVAAVRMGRRIFDNLKKAMAYIISVHIPIALASLVPVILNWKEMILFPVHIVFLELIIDPACSIVFEAEAGERDIMKRMPRSPKDRLFGRRSLVTSAIQGLVAFGVVIACLRSGALPRGERGPGPHACLHYADRIQSQPHPHQPQLAARRAGFICRTQPRAPLGHWGRAWLPRSRGIRPGAAAPFPLRYHAPAGSRHSVCRGSLQHRVVRGDEADCAQAAAARRRRVARGNFSRTR